MAEESGERLKIRRQGDDRANAEIAVRPAVQASADSIRKRVIDCGVTNRASDSDGAKIAFLEKSLNADNRVGLKQRDGRFGILQADGSLLNRIRQYSWELSDIDLE